MANVSAANARLFVARLPWVASRDSLWNYFKQFGQLRDAKIAFDMNTGRSKKYGFITFKEAADAQKAVESGPHFVDGKEISAVFSNPTPAVKNEDFDANQ